MDAMLLGRDHPQYGRVVTTNVGHGSAVSISVGADDRSPSLQYKGRKDAPNEDALCIVDRGDHVVMAVADAHFGDEASHQLISRLHGAFTKAIPVTTLELRATLERMADAPQATTASESTLLVAAFDRDTGEGSAVSFGDSTLVVVTATGECRYVNAKDDRYVAAGAAWPVQSGSVNDFTAKPGDTLLMFTDGIDECHYRRPATSVQDEHIIEIVGRPGSTAVDVSDELAQLALAGVDGNPGGQDNLAIIVVQL